VLGIACREIAPAAAALAHPLAAAGVVQNLGLAHEPGFHEPGFEEAEVVLGPAVVSADWTKL
jgi:hypothetical protein